MFVSEVSQPPYFFFQPKILLNTGMLPEIEFNQPAQL
jgi:hypothetical protein